MEDVLCIGLKEGKVECSISTSIETKLPGFNTVIHHHKINDTQMADGRGREGWEEGMEILIGMGEVGQKL
jgi:hypothetical protein